MLDEVDSDCIQRRRMIECWLDLMEDVHDLDIDSFTSETFICRIVYLGHCTNVDSQF